MGKEPPLKCSQRGQDAREEVPMRTPKRLYAQERIIYQPEGLSQGAQLEVYTLHSTLDAIQQR